MQTDKIVLRQVTPDDKKFIFQLANDPSVRSTSFHTQNIDWKTHCQWFDLQLTAKHLFFIPLYTGIPCGYIRFKKIKKHILAKNEDLMLSLAVDPIFRRKHVATAMIQESCRLILQNTSFHRIYAQVKIDNTASLRLFEKCHFLRTGTIIKSGIPAVCFVYPGYEELL